MSIILKGIDLPQTLYTDIRIYWDGRIKKIIGENTMISYKNTQAIQIPKGHGRLIDADALYKFFEDALNKNPLDDWWEAGAVLDNIELAPTILEAEE